MEMEEINDRARDETQCHQLLLSLQYAGKASNHFLASSLPTLPQGDVQFASCPAYGLP